MIGIILVACLIIVLILEDKKSSKKFYEKRINGLKTKKETLETIVHNLQNKLELKGVNSRELNPEREINQTDIEKAKSIILKKDEEYGKYTTLEDFIIDSIERNGIKKTKEIFNGLVKIYSLTGRDVSQEKLLYCKYFND